MVKKVWGFKYFNGYKNDDKNIIILCIMLPKMSGYRWNFDEAKYISFLIKDKKLLGKCNDILGKVRKTIKKNLIMS